MSQPIQAMMTNKALPGILFMALGIFLSMSMNVIIKEQAAAFPIGQIVFFRNFFGLIPAFLILFLHRKKQAFRFHKPVLHFKRALFGTIGFLLIFLSLKLLNLAESATLLFTTSLFMTALSPLLLKESVGWHRWLAVIAGFCAIAWIKPPTNVMQIGAIIAIGGALFEAMNLLYSRKLSQHDPSATVHFYFTLLSTFLTIPLLLIESDHSTIAMICGWKTMTWTYFWHMLALGIGGSMAFYCMTLASQRAQSATIAPIIYTSIVWAIIFDFVFWGTIPTLKLLVGGCIVIACGLYITWREHIKTASPATQFKI